MDKGFQSFPSRVVWREDWVEAIPRQPEVEGLDQRARGKLVGDDDIAAKHDPLPRERGLDGVRLFAEAEGNGPGGRRPARGVEPALPVGGQAVVGEPVIVDERVLAELGGRPNRLAPRDKTGTADRIVAVAEQLVPGMRGWRPRVSDGETGFVRLDNSVGPDHRKGNVRMVSPPTAEPRHEPTAREGVCGSDAQRRVVLAPTN